MSLPGIVISGSGFSFHLTYCTYWKADRIKEFGLIFQILSVYLSVWKSSAKRTGRPPLPPDRVKGGRIEIRVDRSEAEIYDEAAKLAALDRSEWIRTRLNHAAKRELRQSNKR